MAYNLACLVVFGLAAFARADEPEKLVGAGVASLHEFPYVASIRIRGTHMCGGGIITRRHILTAAHCVIALEEFPLSDITVVTGSNSILPNEGETHNVIKYFKHKEYLLNKRSHWYHDIGVVKLLSPITINFQQSKLVIPVKNPPPGLRGVVMGWGSQSESNGPLSPYLRKLEVSILEHSKCQSFFGTKIYDHMLCTVGTENNLGRRTGTCEGDSGSPLVHRNQIIGIVSGGVACALGYPDIFTNVYMHVDFIKEAVLV